MSIASPIAPPAMPDLPICRLSVEQYHRMTSAGILVEGDPIELLEGWLVPKPRKSRPHVCATGLTRREVETTVGKGWYVDTHAPITTDDSEPEPDVSVVSGGTRDYCDRHPGPSEAGLLVEIADTSLERDRNTKKRIYARAEVRMYWIINLVDRQVEVYTDPTGPTDEPDYRHRQDYRVNDEIPIVLDGKHVGCIPVRELLP